MTRQPIDRLQNLRQDMLAAEYQLCTQKARLMTRYFREHRKRWEGLFNQAYRWSVGRLMAKQAAGEEIRRLNRKVGSAIFGIKAGRFARARVRGQGPGDFEEPLVAV